MLRRLPLCLISIAILVMTAEGSDGNRFAHLDPPIDPYWVSRTTARFVTPQWVGEENVDCVAILSIDDMRDVMKYERFLRPLIDRIKAYQRKAGFTIFTNEVNPYDPHLLRWQNEGGSIEVHTLTHPCPLLQNRNLYEAKRSYDGCVDLLSRIPGPGPVAFRMPCCDSMNSVSPRFFDLIFNRTTPNGQFLEADSSVFLVLDEADPDLPRDWVVEEDGRGRFRKYIPVDRWMANLIYNYPYPYVIGGLCWEFPCLMPSDWDAQYLHGVRNPITVRDWIIGLKAIAKKQGVFTLVFHPHGWIDAEQVGKLVDAAQQELSGRVRFLSIAEAVRRIRTNALKGESLRRADGGDNGVRIVDVNNDGFMDVLIANDRLRLTRIWNPNKGTWVEKPFPVPLVEYVAGEGYRARSVIFGAVGAASTACFLDAGTGRFWLWDEQEGWVERAVAVEAVNADGEARGRSGGIVFRDIDGDGSSELVCGSPGDGRIFTWHSGTKGWKEAPFRLPEHVAIEDERGGWNGVWFRDLNADGALDVVMSNPWRVGVYLFADMRTGWREIFSGERPSPEARQPVPTFVRTDGSLNGAWFHGRYLYLQNEDTGGIEKNHVIRIRLRDLMELGTERGSE